MSNKNIPAGYQIQILSWENDADCFKTETFSGLTKDEVLFLIDLSMLLRNVNGHYSDNCFGGNNRSDNVFTKLYSEMKKVYLKHAEKVNDSKVLQYIVGSLSEELEPDDEDSMSDISSEVAIELVSYPEEENYGGEYIRVFDSYTVFHFPSEVKDVTSEFQ